MRKTLVIAEPGCTHEGRLAALLQLLETAAACGADVFKPAWVSNVDQMLARRHIGWDHPQGTYYERAYTWLAFPVEWHADLRERCRQRGMQYACTAFLPQDVATLAPFVDYLKISSFESRDHALIAAVELSQKPGFVSMGMAEADDFERAWLTLPLNVLHCVSAYPAPLAEMNLRALRHTGEGLSDHSHHVMTGAVAVACGALIIESHFRLDECDPQNPDYAVAFTPAEFAQYIQNIRDAETMLGDGVKTIHPCEAAMLPYRVTSP